MSDTDKLNLWQKIHAVMQDVEYLKKDDTIKYENKNTGTSTNYKAISEEKVTSTVRASLVRYGLVIIPIEQAHKKDGSLSTVDTKYKIIDIDTGAFEIAVSSGTGVDTQDKGVGKAMTYSYKYLLLRSFGIPTGDDPDKISSDELSDKVKSSVGIKTNTTLTGKPTTPVGTTGQGKTAGQQSQQSTGQSQAPVGQGDIGKDVDAAIKNGSKGSVQERSAAVNGCACSKCGKPMSKVFYDATVKSLGFSQCTKCKDAETKAS